MALDYPVVYWRDKNTKTSSTLYDSVEKLVAAKPLQCVKFDSTNIQIESIFESPQSNIIDEPEANPSGEKTIHKQEGGALPNIFVLEGNLKVTEIVKRGTLRSFSRMAQIEAEYHKYGVIGVFFPSDLNDFSLDPTNVIGYTLLPPVFKYSSPQNIITFTLTFSLGAKKLT